MSAKSAKVSLLKKVKNSMKVLAGRFYYLTGKVADNKLFVMTYDNKYSCNPKYIADAIIRQNLPIDIVWVGDGDSSDSFPSQIRVVRRTSLKMYKEQTSAKIWLDNGFNCLWYGIPKKKKQVYINTWHGSMGIKKLKGDVQWMAYAERCNDVTDYMIANSTFEEEVYRTTFWPDTPVLKCGHARNDILFEKDNFERLRSEVAEYFGVGTDKKLLLYAPTFRDSGDVSCYNIDYEALKNSLEEKYGSEWIILVRMHYKDRTGEVPLELKAWLKDASQYPDMQKLIATVDFGITDYSSWAYDYVLTRRPMILYAPDAKQYQKGRGLYYPLEETPFPVAQNNKELTEAVLSFNEQEYQLKIDEFLDARGCYEQGTAAKQIVEKIKEIMDIE